MAAYEASLKIARDNYSHDETVRKESRRERDLEIAIKLIAKGHSIEEIAEITGLSKEEIENL
ncbi:helix-turn-helix domain-containing protein [Pedobacter steynii]